MYAQTMHSPKMMTCIQHTHRARLREIQRLAYGWRKKKLSTHEQERIERAKLVETLARGTLYCRNADGSRYVKSSVGTKRFVRISKL
jgi:hypothetical protein